MKIVSKIVTVPASQTNAQLETLLNAILKDGYTLIQVVTYSSRTIAVFIKTVAE